MKNLLSLFVVLFIFVGSSCAQKKATSPAMVSESENVTVKYGAPLKKDRIIFGELVPYDKVWRTGANNATEVTFKKDVIFGDAKVKAGTYTLFTIPGKDSWEIILNSDLGQWGAYKYKEDKNIATISVDPENTNETEQFTINASDNSISLKWETTEVIIPLEF